MSQQQQSFINLLKQIYRDTGCPVSTTAVATRSYYSPAWTRRQLNELAKQGQIQRVGQRKGWLPAIAA